MKTKTCSKCGKEKPLSEFCKSSIDKYRYICKECKEQVRQYHREYYKEHKETIKRTTHQWYEKNKAYKKQYEKEYIRKRRKSHSSLRLETSMSSAIWQALKGNKNSRHWETLVGYTLEQLKQRLRTNFKEGMTWDNYGDWHIDHIKPKSLFNYDNPEDQEFHDCWMLANLQPLWAEENIRKQDSWV